MRLKTKRIKGMKNYISIVLLFTAALLGGCSDDITAPEYGVSKGEPLVMEVTLEGLSTVATTRATHNTTDLWSISAFEIGDKASFYTLGGIQNPEDPTDFTLSAINAEVYCQSKTSTTYRFGNSDIVLDPMTLGTYYSRIFYPFYPEMPLPYDDTPQRGLTLRQTDPKDGIVKCIDFMMSDSEKIPISSGAISPKFQHNFCPLYIKRGEGFQHAPDQRVWVVMKEPLTDVRITQTTPEGPFSYKLQYNPEETGDDLMIYILEGESKFKVNKYCVWQAWDGANSATNFTQYVLIPTGPVSPWQSIYFIFMQDDYGNWQNVNDFYLYTSGSKSLQTGYYYTLTISLKGVDVVARPISVLNWNDEMEITDNRKMGINDYVEYNEWARTYNSYVERGRPRDMEEDLTKFGEAVYNTVTDYTTWTFLINHDIDFANKDEFYQINKLEDALEGTSSYTRYKLSNTAGPLIGELAEGGAVRSLEMNDLYFIQPDNDTEPYSPFIRTLSGGTIENFHITNSIIVSHTPVGMVAGEANGGTVTNCYFSGDVIGTESAVVEGKKGLFGTVGENIPTVASTNTTGLKFIEN